MLLSKSEISNNGTTITHEDIGQFEVTMQIAALGHFNKAGNNVLHDLKDFLFSESPALLEEAAEVALIAVLGNNVAVGCLADDVVTLQDIGVFNLGERLDLTV